MEVWAPDTELDSGIETRVQELSPGLWHEDLSQMWRSGFWDGGLGL